MAILKVARMGHPVLRRVADPVSVANIKTPALQQLIEDMIETMHEYQGVGLAAPQVHQSIRLSVIEIPDTSKRYPGAKEVDLSIFINPEVKLLTESTSTYWEGCLSVPG